MFTVIEMILAILYFLSNRYKADFNTTNLSTRHALLCDIMTYFEISDMIDVTLTKIAHSTVGKCPAKQTNFYSSYRFIGSKLLSPL